MLMLTGVAVAPGEAIGPAVVVRLRTHDAGDRVTALDADLARRIDACASFFRP